MTAQEIIDKFELYVDDSTELSETEELDLLNKVYQRVCSNRPWEFLKKSATGNLSTTVPYIALPSDFGYLSENNQYTDNSVGIDNNASPKVVFIGTAFTPYQIINFSDRRQYKDQVGYAYVDYANDRLVFTSQPTSADSYEFDYVAFPATLTLSDTPAFPARFHDVLVHLMAVDSMIIQMFPKAQSYATENQIKANDILADIAYYNAQLRMD